MTALARLLPDRSGAILIEIALLLPLVLLLVLGVVDIGRFVVAVQKIERTAVALADRAGREATLNAANQGAIFSAARYTLSPYSLGTEGTMLLSVLRGQATGNTARVEWQGRSGAVLASAIGTAGTVVPAPAGITMAENDALIVSEIVYRHHFIFLPEAMFSGPVRKVGYARARSAEFRAG